MNQGIDYIGVGVGVAIFNNEGELLLMKRGPKAKNEIGSWMLPGGSVEFNERLESTAHREINEELGIAIYITGQLPAYDHILSEEKQHWVTNIFTARITQGQPKILEPEKCDKLGWFALTDLPSPIAQASQGVLTYFLDIQK